MTEQEAKKHALWPDFEKWWRQNAFAQLPESQGLWWSCFLAGARASSEFRAAVDEGEKR